MKATWLTQISCALGLLLVAACDRSDGSMVELNAPTETWPDTATAAKPQTNGDAVRDAAVIVGLEDYSVVDDIPGAAANAADWHRHLAKSVGVPIENIHILRNHEATRENILARADQAAAQVKPGGRLWFVFIGHGAPARGARQDAWLVGWDAQRTPESLEARSVSQAQLIAKLEQSPGQPIVVLDACFNGKTAEGNRLLPAGLQDLEFAEISGGTRAVVFSAAGADEYAGPLPGAKRPAFSYLMLGALRGWADENGDKRVTASEALSYSQKVLITMVKQRRQTPEIVGNQGASTVLASGVDESGPDLEEMALRGAGATELAVNAEIVSAPDAELLEPVQMTIGDINIDAEKAYETAMDVQEDFEALPEEKASAWCALARISESSNPYRFQALSMCREWQVYARALRRLEQAMVDDYETLRQYLELERKTEDQKMAAIAGFLNGYTELSSGDYPHISEVLEAQKKIHAGKPAKMPSLSHIQIGPNGWISTTDDGADIDDSSDSEQ